MLLCDSCQINTVTHGCMLCQKFDADLRAHYKQMKRGEKVTTLNSGHTFLVVALDTVQATFLVACVACRELIADETYGSPIAHMTQHIAHREHNPRKGVDPDLANAYELGQLRARLDEPIPMRLNCPSCGELHVDVAMAEKPHHTHACQHCGMVWRPAIVKTVGVHFLPGFKDS